ncbi:MAG: outer membrane beta-barrel protein, partial [Actinomycetospora chiangmaiensis]|nr:outer membrane beta-barrel protein [Actinomycetospora chiangmaiensis]
MSFVAAGGGGRFLWGCGGRRSSHGPAQEAPGWPDGSLASGRGPSRPSPPSRRTVWRSAWDAEGGAVRVAGALRARSPRSGAVRASRRWNGRAGLAFGNVRIDSNLTAFNRSVFDAREGEVRTGYAVGAGLEHAFTDHLSAKVEGLYYDLGSRSALAAPIGRVLPGYRAGARIATDGFLTRVGLNYRFGAGLPSDGPAAPSPWAFEGGLRYFY